MDRTIIEMSMIASSLVAVTFIGGLVLIVFLLRKLPFHLKAKGKGVQLEIRVHSEKDTTGQTAPQ